MNRRRPCAPRRRRRAWSASALRQERLERAQALGALAARRWGARADRSGRPGGGWCPHSRLRPMPRLRPAHPLQQAHPRILSLASFLWVSHRNGETYVSAERTTNQDDWSKSTNRHPHVQTLGDRVHGFHGSSSGSQTRRRGQVRLEVGYEARAVIGPSHSNRPYAGPLEARYSLQKRHARIRQTANGLAGAIWPDPKMIEERPTEP